MNTHREIIEKYIPIPKIKVSDEGVEEYNFVDFDVDFSDFHYVPIENGLLVKRLDDTSERQRIKGNLMDTIQRRKYLHS